MPFVKPEDAAITDGMPVQFTDPRLTYKGPGWEDTFDAAFTLYNPIKSLAQWGADNWDPKTPYSGEPPPDFDPLAHIAGYEPWADNFADAQTPGEVVTIKRRIDRENLARDTIAAAGGKGIVASIAAGLADPTIILPIGKIATGGMLSARIGKSALSMAGAGAGVGAIQASILYGTQETKTVGESLVEIGAGAVLGGLLGGAIPAGGAAWRRLRGGVDEAASPLSRAGGWDYATDHAFTDGDIRPLGDLNRFVNEHLADQGGGFKADPGLDVTFHTGAISPEFRRVLAEQNPDFAVPPGDIFISGRSLAQLGQAEEAALRGINLDRIAARDGVLLPNPTADSPWARPWLALAETADHPALIAELKPSAKGIEITKLISPSEVGNARVLLVRLGLTEDQVRIAPRAVSPQEVNSLSGGAEERRGSVGAAAVRDTTLKDEGIASALGAEAIPFIQHQDPLIRTHHSPSLEVRRTVQGLAETPLMLEKNKQGIPTEIAAETLIKQSQSLLYRALPQLDQAFYAYRGLDGQALAGVRTGLKDTIGSGQRAADGAVMLSKHDFFEEVGRAMRRGDAHAIPQVAEAARTMRKEVFDQLKDDAITLGLLPEDVAVETATSYLMRVYNHEKIIAERPRFVRIVADWLEGEQVVKNGLRERSVELLERHRALIAQEKEILAGLKGKGALEGAEDLQKQLGDVRGKIELLREDMEAAAQQWPGKTTAEAVGALRRRATKEATREAGKPRLREADKTVLKAVEAMAGAETRLERQELESLAGEITDRILGTPAGRLPYDAHKAHGPNGRAWGDRPKDVNGPLLQRSFAIPDELIEDFLESNAEDIARRYVHTMAPDIALTRKFGNPDMIDQMDQIRDDYAKMSLHAGDDPKAQKKLAEAMKRDMRDLGAIRDRLRGTYMLPDNPNGLLVRTGRIARNVNYLRLLGGMTLSALTDVGSIAMTHGVKRFFGQGMPLFDSQAKALWRLSAQEVKLAGTALDMVLDSRAMAMADIMDEFGRNSRFERGLVGLTRKFGVVSLMAPWNTAMKQITGVITQTRMLEAIESLHLGRDIPQAEFQRLAHLGIGKEMVRRIGDEFATHGKKAKGTWWANTENWADRAAVETYHAAIVKEVDRVIVTPGVDKPLWMSSELGKLIGQFKTFAFASTQRTLLAGLQRRDAAVLNGVMLMLGLGELSYLSKTWIADRDVSDDPLEHLREAAFRSGVLAWLPDAADTVAKVGGKSSSRYASRSPLEALAGPTFGSLGNEVVVAAQSFTDPDHRWTEYDTHRMRRFLPFQNVFYLSWLFDQAERGINEAAGVPMRRR